MNICFDYMNSFYWHWWPNFQYTPLFMKDDGWKPIPYNCCLKGHNIHYKKGISCYIRCHGNKHCCGKTTLSKERYIIIFPSTAINIPRVRHLKIAIRILSLACFFIHIWTTAFALLRGIYINLDLKLDQLEML